MRPLEKHKQYSCRSRSVGFDAEHHDPQAQLELAPEALTQMTSPRGKNPISQAMAVTVEARGT
jgi:hypothetical protein